MTATTPTQLKSEPAKNRSVASDSVGDLKMESGETSPDLVQEEIVEAESDSSSDSYGSRKQLKSPHTVLKNPSTSNAEPKRGATPKSTLSEDQTEHFVRLLQETEQNSRDTLISMLQEQLKKIENLYKQSLDDTQELRFKYCVTTQELSNLRTICEKYKEDIETLVKEKNQSDANKDILKLQKEVENWKVQYDEVLKQIQLDNNAAKQSETVSKETQMDINCDLKDYIDTLKEHYVCIKDSLQYQNDKLELLVGKLLENSEAENMKKKHLEELVIENVTTENDQYVIEQNASEIKRLKDEIKTLQTEIEQLSIEKIQLQLVITDPVTNTSNENLDGNKPCCSLNTLKEEVKLLKENNADLHIQLNQQIALKQENENLKEQLRKHISINDIVEENTISNLENTEKENSMLPEEVDSLKLMFNVPHEFRECFCSSNVNVTESTTEDPTSPRSRKNSKVSFIGGNSRLQEEFSELVKENSHLKLVIKELQGDARRSDEVEKCSIELVHLRRQLKQAEEEKQTSQDLVATVEVKNALIRDLQQQKQWLKNDYEDILKTSELTTSDLKKKTAEINEKETAIQELRVQIQELQTKLENNNNEVYKDAIDEVDKLKDALDAKTKELDEKVEKIHELQQKEEEMKMMLAKCMEEHEQYNRKLANQENFEDALRKLKGEQRNSLQLTEELKIDNEALKLQIDEMAKTLQQYKEQAEFKKLENEKLRKKEEQMQEVITCNRRNSEGRAKELSIELENNTKMLNEITEEYNNFKLECQNKTSKLTEENTGLQKLVNARDKEIGDLNEEINEIRKELENAQLLHQKDVGVHERSLSEITCLFKIKENELALIENTLQKQQDLLKKLEEENNQLKNILNEKAQALKEKEKRLSDDVQREENEEKTNISKNINQINQLRILEENYKNEKIKNSEMNIFVDKIRKELNDLKIQLRELLASLEYKLMQLKMDIKRGKCGAPLSRKGINEMLERIEKFNSSVLQSENTRSADETEKFSYFYEDTKLNNVKTEDNLNSNFDTIVECKYKNTAINGKDLSPATNMTKNLSDQSQDLSNMTIRDLTSKREFLVNKLKSIDQKLKTDNLTATPKCIPIAESDLISPSTCNKTIQKRTYCTRESTDDLLFKRKYYTEKISLIDDKLKATATIKENKENKTINNALSENKCSSTNTYWKQNLQIIQQIASDVNELKMGLATKGDTTSNGSQNKSVKDCCVQKCPLSSNLQLQIINLEEQVNATTLMCKEIDELELRLEPQHPKLQEDTNAQVQQYENNMEICKIDPSCSVNDCISEKIESEQKEKAATVTQRNDEYARQPECEECSSSESPTNNFYNNKETEISEISEFQDDDITCIKNAPSPTTAIPKLAQNLQNKSKLPTNNPAGSKPKLVDYSSLRQCKCLDKNQREMPVPSFQTSVAVQSHTESKGTSSQQYKCRTPSGHCRPQMLPTNDPSKVGKCICVEMQTKNETTKK